MAGWNQPVAHNYFIVFTRLRDFYNTFTVLSALVAALSAGVLTFDEMSLSLIPTTPARKSAPKHS